MLMNELVGTCSHAAIAEAAVISIGPVFHARVARIAHRDDLSVGEFAARAVRRFAAEASEADWEDLRHICARQDMPILRGLHHILEMAMEEDESARADGGWRAYVAASENARNCSC